MIEPLNRAKLADVAETEWPNDPARQALYVANAGIGQLNALIAAYNDQQKALDYLDAQNLLLNQRVAALEAKYGRHVHYFDVANDATGPAVPLPQQAHGGHR